LSKDIFEHIKRLPPVLALRKRRYERSFSTTAIYGFRGIYQTFELALASAPKTKPKGYDVQEFEGHFDNRRGKLFLYDYPFLYWLCRILRRDSCVFDIGGNTGVHFTSYRGFLPHWEQLRWEVCEVPVIVKEGERFAEREGYSDRLTFTSELNAADGKNIMLSSGTLQYIDKSLADILSVLDNPPQHILINKLPLYDGEDYVTLQNCAVTYAAQRVFNRTKFLGQVRELGYQLVDYWNDDSRSCRVPFYPERDLPYFSGIYLSKHPPGDINA
jgi:putative methyltransferase (TIGR04325 family)